jgi:hypothetical protein
VPNRINNAGIAIYDDLTNLDVIQKHLDAGGNERRDAELPDEAFDSAFSIFGVIDEALRRVQSYVNRYLEHEVAAS